MWLTITDYGPTGEQPCEIAECDQSARYIKDDRFQRNVCPKCRDFYDQWRSGPTTTPGTGSHPPAGFNPLIHRSPPSRRGRSLPENTGGKEDLVSATKTRHTCGGPAFGRLTTGCPRCDQLAAGAPPVTWKNSARDRARREAEDAEFRREHFASARHNNPSHRDWCGPVCTFGDW